MLIKFTINSTHFASCHWSPPIFLMPTCNGKIKGKDGEVDNCPCAWYIPDPTQEASGPCNCYDCLHFESAHPLPNSQSTVSSVLASLKSRIDTIREPSSMKPTPVASEDEAWHETNSHKVSTGSTSGHGGSDLATGWGRATKYKVCRVYVTFMLSELTDSWKSQKRAHERLKLRRLMRNDAELAMLWLFQMLIQRYVVYELLNAHTEFKISI